MKKETGRPGERLEDFLEGQGTYDEATAVAVKRVVAFQLAEAMKAHGITKVEMGRRLKTSRSQLDRLLDPEHDGVTLSTLAHAAGVLGLKLRVELEPATPPAKGRASCVPSEEVSDLLDRSSSDAIY